MSDWNIKKIDLKDSYMSFLNNEIKFINLAVLFYIFAVSTLLIWYYIVLPIIV